MSSVAVYSSRSRASERTRNIRNDMNRASAYILQNDYSTPSSYTSSKTYKTPSTPTVKRRTRDSSLGALGRSNRDSSITRTSTYARESSMPRYKELLNTSSTLTPNAPTSLIISTISNRHSIAIPTLDNGLGSETAKYKRENELKEIHNSFMKGFKDTNNKLSNEKTIIADDQGDRRSKAYAKIIGDQSSYSAEVDYQRHNYSDMYIETGKFSTRTLSAIKNLDSAEIKQKRRDPGEYSWRKDMEQYEKSSEFEQEQRIRNIANVSRQRDDTEGKENQRNMSIQNRNRNSLLNINTKESATKPPQSPKTRVKFTAASKPEEIVAYVRTPTKVTKTARPVVEEPDFEAPAPRKSWRDRVAENEKDEPVKIPIKVARPKVDAVEETPRKSWKERKAEEEKAKSVKTPTKVTNPATNEIEEPVFEPPKPYITYKQRQAEKEKDGYTKTKEELDLEKSDRQKARESARAIRQQLEAELEEMNKNFAKSAKKPTDEAPVDKEAKSKVDGEKGQEANEEKGGASQEEDDAYGSNKMKADFDARMLAMEEEFAAGRNQLSKVKERIRKAKGLGKEADTAIEDSKSS